MLHTTSLSPLRLLWRSISCAVWLATVAHLTGREDFFYTIATLKIGWKNLGFFLSFLFINA